jgi:sugar phosphate isomerase/epimerase
MQELFNRLQLYINAAKITGGKLIIGCVRGNIAGQDYNACMDRLALGMKELLRRASDSGITVLLEAINRYENDYLATAAHIVSFIEKYDLKGLKILLDTFHMNIEERSLAEAFRTAAEYLGHIHSSDNSRRVPGSGALPWPEIIRTLKSIGYNDVLSFEVIVDEDEDREAREGLNYLRGIIGGIKSSN